MNRGRKFRVYLAIIPMLFTLLSTAPASALATGGCNVSLASSSGVVLVDSGGYCYLAFTATGANSFTVPNAITSASVLVVAGGGGGGGGAWGGGGGAGGVLTSTSYPLTAGATMNISVGAGGSGGAATLDPSLNRGVNGTNSWINSSSTFVAVGGGAGSGYAYGTNTANIADGSAGGSGFFHLCAAPAGAGADCLMRTLSFSARVSGGRSMMRSSGFRSSSPATISTVCPRSRPIRTP